MFQEGSLPGNARKKMSFVLHSDHLPPPKLAISVPASENAFQFTEEPRDPAGGRCGSKVAYTSPLVEQVCKIFPLTNRCKHVFQKPRAIQEHFLQDKAGLPGAMCTTARCRTAELFLEAYSRLLPENF